MKHLIILILSLCSIMAAAQTVTNPPSGSKPYGTPVATPSGEIMVGRSGSYTYITRKAYTDSLTALGYTKLQVDSAIQAELANETLQSVTGRGNTTNDKIGVITDNINSNVYAIKIGEGVPTDPGNHIAITDTQMVDPALGSYNGINSEVVGVATGDGGGRISRAVKGVGYADPNGYTLSNSGGGALGVEGVARALGDNGGTINVATGGYFRVMNDSENVGINNAVSVYVNSPQITTDASATIGRTIGLYVANQNKQITAENSADIYIGTEAHLLTGKYGIINTSVYDNYFQSNLGISVSSPEERLDVGSDGYVNGQGFKFNNAGFKTDLSSESLTGDRTVLLPNLSGTLALTSQVNGYEQYGLGVWANTISPASAWDGLTTTQFAKSTNAGDSPFADLGQGIHIAYNNNRGATLFFSGSSSTTTAMQFRNTTGAGVWGPVRTVWHDGNFTPSNYVDKSSNETIGGDKTFTGEIEAASFSTTGGTLIDANVSTDDVTATGEIQAGSISTSGNASITGTVSAANINELPTRSLNTSLGDVIAGQTLTYTTTYTGVSNGDVIAVGVSGSIGATDLIITASSTSTAGQAIVKFYNPTGSDISIGNISIKLKAFK